MELLTMSKKELSRVEVMERIKAKKMTQKNASEALGLSVRHVRRLWKNYQAEGAVGLVSKRRGIIQPGARSFFLRIDKTKIAICITTTKRPGALPAKVGRNAIVN